MSNNHDREMDLQLDRHIDALRSEQIPGGPSPQVVADTLAMLCVAGSTLSVDTKSNVNDRPTFFERMIKMVLRHRLAAAVTMTLSAAAVYVMLMLLNHVPQSLAFADVAEKLRSARTLSYTTTGKVGGWPSLLMGPMKSKIFFVEPDRMRIEFSEGNVSISVGHVSLMLVPQLRTATRTERFDASGNPVTFGGAMRQIEAFRNLPANTGKPVGDKIIDGVEARGFLVCEQEITMTFWADKKTALPIRIESKQDKVTIIMDDFSIDAPIDDVMFSLEVPEGYKLTTKTQGPLPEKIEDFVAEILQGYAEATDGSLPPKLNDWNSFNRVAKNDPKGRLDNIGALTGRLSRLDEYGYAGKDVKLGERDKVVFWYLLDPSLPTYRVLYGDLRVADVSKDMLPMKKSWLGP